MYYKTQSYLSVDITFLDLIRDKLLKKVNKLIKIYTVGVDVIFNLNEGNLQPACIKIVCLCSIKRDFSVETKLI